LAATARRAGLASVEIDVLRRHFSALPVRPDAAALDDLAARSARIASDLRSAIDLRQGEVERGIELLMATLVASLLLPLHGLWRQRQRLRSSLHEFSDSLESGNWHDAVQNLRNDRLGAPSAFDALATGVEGVLGESDRRWRALADLSADWYWETDTEQRLCWIAGTPPMTGVLGWAQEDLIGRRRDEVPFFEAPAIGWDRYREGLERMQALRDLEFRVFGRQGNQVRWVAISGRPRVDAFGEFVGYEGVGRDITERKAAHERLAASEQRWSLMAGLASDWYWETDAEHRVLPLAPEFRRRMPFLAERVLGRARWEAHRDSLSPAEWAEHHADLEARRPFRALQFEVPTGDGKFAWLSISGIPRFDGQGRFLGYHGVGRDVTVRKQAERVLLRHNEELQRAVAARTAELEQLNRDLEAFSRQLAHELRTPITHIQGLAHLIEARAGERLHSDERQLIELQVQSAHHMRDTVDALMLLARSTVQSMPQEGVDLSHIARQVAHDLAPLERCAEIEWRIEPGLRALAAPAPLRIVFANLLGNSAKFTRRVERPWVSVSARTDPDGRVRVAVCDNGVGFDPALAGRLFTPFNRLHGGDEFHGTGIGLSIVQRIVERHGGSVSARGAVGEGACFEFTLDAAPEAPPQVEAAEEGATGARATEPSA
ncbi:MAG: PAS domain S-box protein, partial [Burkholderiales bacterium]|nr:PAS domain S-box protein [Burkholderiales bacterium]